MTSRASFTTTRQRAVACAAAAFFMCAPGHGMAAGALAVGQPADVARGGFTYGFSYDKADEQEARQEALQQCRTTKDAAQDANLRSLCTVVRTYSNQCIAVAMDPRAGTPGIGWAFAAELRDAESQALAQCRQTDGPEQADACVVDHSGCDGGAK
jgi:uncharacterized protein DUF4189